MPDASRPWPRILGAAAAGIALTVLAAAGPWLGIAAALAQPCFALAVSWWRGTRAPAWSLRDAGSLAGAWVAGLAVVAVLVAWPLAALRETGSLSAAIGLSVV